VCDLKRYFRFVLMHPLNYLFIRRDEFVIVYCRLLEAALSIWTDIGIARNDEPYAPFASSSYMYPRRSVTYPSLFTSDSFVAERTNLLGTTILFIFIGLKSRGIFLFSILTLQPPLNPLLLEGGEGGGLQH